MNKFFVILIAVIVTVASAAHIPANLNPAVHKIEPVLQKVIDYLHQVKKDIRSEDVYEKDSMADSIAEVPQEKEIDSLEEFRQKPVNLKALLKQIEKLEKQKSDIVVPKKFENLDKTGVLLNFGLDKPVKNADDSEKATGEEEIRVGDNIVPISVGMIEETVDMNKKAFDEEEDSDIQVSFGLDQPIEASAVRNHIEEGDDEEESDLEVAEKKENDEDSDIQESFGLSEPILFSAIKNIISEADEDEDEEEVSANVNEKFMSEVINAVIHKFAQAYNLKL